MTEPLQIARNSTQNSELLPHMANRHGLISGATGTGKTFTLQRIMEQFSKIGVPVFATDIKGDLTGISQPGQVSSKLATILQERGITPPEPFACPTMLWDVFGEQGHPVRATISDMGPLLLSRMLNLNETQAGVLTLIFKVADDNHLLLLDMKDLRSAVQFVGENAGQFTTQYGNVSSASVGAIQRGLLQLEAEGAEHFFGEPMLNMNDMLQTIDGKGVINILSADKLMNAPRVYAAFLLWMLSELFEQLPEVGDLDKPKFILFFDEAHLIFKDAPKALLERIELVVRLIRSKGVGVFFATQNPTDIPQSVLAQLGNRVQHALRAFSAQDQKAVKAIAQTMPINKDIHIEQSITEMATGEALISFLDAKGQPGATQRVFVIPPCSQNSPITTEQRQQLIKQSLVAGVYEKIVDRESAYEILQKRDVHTQTTPQTAPAENQSGQNNSMLKDILLGSTGPRGGHRDGILQTLAKTAARSLGREATKSGGSLLRGILGSLLKK
ncbi:MAG: helicase HerA-like domain-containing protein [Saezia sp.]